MKFLLLIFAFIIFSYSAQNIQSRHVGKVEDIKYVGQDKYDNFVFWLNTDQGRCYVFSSTELPYFEIGDSLMTYWIDYRLKGIGNSKQSYYYEILQ